MEKDDDYVAGAGDHTDEAADENDGIDNRDGDGDMLEEDIRVVENCEGWIDVEEDHNDEETPVNSDSEEGGVRHVRLKKGSGELMLGQVFDTIPHFKDAVVDYALKEMCK